MDAPRGPPTLTHPNKGAGGVSGPIATVLADGCQKFGGTGF